MGEDVIIVAKNRNGARGPIPVMLNVHKLKFYPPETHRTPMRATEESDDDSQ
jgi:hypothetical protein